MSLGLALPDLEWLALRSINRQARYRHRLAPAGIPLILDVEEPPWTIRPSGRFKGHASTDTNPLWGAPRIHGELLELDIKVSQASVAKYMGRYRKPPSQTWRTFLSNHVAQIASIDFFTVPTISFQILYVFIVLAHDRRRILHVKVAAHPSAEWTVQQIVGAFPFDSAPKYLLRDREGIYGFDFRKQVDAMGITEVLSAPRSPWQSPYVERVIGSIRRECLDHVVVFDEDSLRHSIRAYISYYHESRLHLSLGKDSPDPRAVHSAGNVVAIPQVGGLHHRYERRAA